MGFRVPSGGGKSGGKGGFRIPTTRPDAPSSKFKPLKNVSIPKISPVRGFNLPIIKKPSNQNFTVDVEILPFFLYKGEDFAIYAGDRGLGSTLDYPAFVDAGRFSNGDLCYGYRLGSDHNNTKDASMYFVRQLSGVWQSPVLVQDDAGGTRLITDPSITITSTDRVLYAYKEVFTSPSGKREAYQKISDDGGLTFGSEIDWTDDQVSPNAYFDQQMNSPIGSGIEIDGILYNGVYATSNIGILTRGGRFYKSIDNGTTWSFVSQIWPEGLSSNGEEPCFTFFEYGAGYRILCAQRSDPLGLIRLFYSDDLGLTWSGPVDIGLEGFGKPAIRVSVNGTVMIMTRELVTYRTIYTYTTDEGGITGYKPQMYLSERENQYMYGSLIANSEGGFTLFVAEEGLGTTPLQGPNLIIQKTILESQVAVDEKTEYDKDYRNWLDFAQAYLSVEGFEPASSLKSLQSELIELLKTDTIFDKMDYLWLFGKTDLDGAQIIDLIKSPFVKPWRALGSYVNSPVLSNDGLQFDGVTNYFDTSQPMSLQNKYLQNDAGVIIMVENNLAQDRLIFGSSDANFSSRTHGPNLIPRGSTDLATYQINDSTQSTIASADSSGLWFLQRPNAGNKALWKNGVQIHTAAVTSTARSSKNVFVGCGNYNNGPNLFSNSKVSMFGFGNSLAGLEAQLNTRLQWYRTQLASL